MRRQSQWGKHFSINQVKALQVKGIELAGIQNGKYLVRLSDDQIKPTEMTRDEVLAHL